MLSLADGQAQFAGGRIDVIVSRKDRFNDVIAHVSGIFAQRIAILDIIIAVLRGVIPIKLKLVNRNQITGVAVEINHQRSGILNRITTKHTLCLRVALPVSNTRRSLCNLIGHAGGGSAHDDAGGVGARVGGRGTDFQLLLRRFGLCIGNRRNLITSGEKILKRGGMSLAGIGQSAFIGGLDGHAAAVRAGAGRVCASGLDGIRAVIRVPPAMLVEVEIIEGRSGDRVALVRLVRGEDLRIIHTILRAGGDLDILIVFGFVNRGDADTGVAAQTV